MKRCSRPALGPIMTLDGVPQRCIGEIVAALRAAAADQEGVNRGWGATIILAGGEGAGTAGPGNPA